MISKRCAYGLQSILYLSRQEPGRYVPVREISKALGIPGSFLSKVTGALTERRMLASQRGPHGGVRLCRESGSLRVREVILALDGPRLFEGCVLGLPGCGVRTPCPMHAYWAQTRDSLSATLDALTIDRLVQLIDEKHDDIPSSTFFSGHLQTK